jgi:GNAT superfamily N-acetyltransferase
MTEPRIDLDRARRDAKALLRAARAGDPEALRRMRQDREPRLADAQLAVARALGARSWPALVRRAEGVDELLAACFECGHEAALAVARERPRAVERVRAMSPPPLVEAARAGNAGAAYALLELGVPPDPAALHVAARYGRPEVVDVLVGWVPLDNHARDAAGRTALGACLQGDSERHLVVAKMLVAVGLRGEPWMAGAAGPRLAAWLAEQPTAPTPGDRFGAEACAAEAELLGYLARSPLAEVRPVGDGFAMRTGEGDNTRNGVVCSTGEDDEIADTLAWLHDVPAQWLVAAGSDLGTRLERAGCRPERTSVHMAAPLDTIDLRDVPTQAEIARVTDVGQLDDTLVASLGVDADAPLRHWTARLDGRGVGLVSVFVAGRTLLGVTLEVAPEHRLRGIGRALVRHALREGRAAGCTVAILAPTPASVPFYAGLGFTLERTPPDRSYYLP